MVAQFVQMNADATFVCCALHAAQAMAEGGVEVHHYVYAAGPYEVSSLPTPLHSPDESCSGPMRVHLHDASERRLLYSPAHLSPLHADGFDDASSRPLPGPSCAAC